MQKRPLERAAVEVRCAMPSKGVPWVATSELASALVGAVLGRAAPRFRRRPRTVASGTSTIPDSGRSPVLAARAGDGQSQADTVTTSSTVVSRAARTHREFSVVERADSISISSFRGGWVARRHVRRLVAQDSGPASNCHRFPSDQHRKSIIFLMRIP